MVKLYGIKLTEEDNQSKISVKIESKNVKRTILWFSVDNKYERFIISDQYDPFLVGLLFSAMMYGENIHIEGKVSKRLLHNLNNYVIPLLMSYSPDLKKIRITASSVNSNRYAGKGVGTGFSGGVDSFHTVYRHYELEDDPDFKLNSFLFLNVGAHGYDGDKVTHSKFKQRYDYLKQFPEEIGLEFIAVDSNLPDFLRWGHQKVHSLTSAAGVLLLQKKYKRYLYASAGLKYGDAIKYADSYKDLDIGAYSDPLLLPLLSTESTDIASDGMSHDRVEKTIEIMNYEPVYRYLNVCVSGDDTHKNCSTCSKCCRTLMTLNSIGRLEEVNHLFDVDKYKNEAEHTYICQQVESQDKDPFAKSNVELAEENGIDLPNRTYASLVTQMQKSKKMVAKNLSEETKETIKKVIRK